MTSTRKKTLAIVGTMATGTIILTGIQLTVPASASDESSGAYRTQSSYQAEDGDDRRGGDDGDDDDRDGHGGRVTGGVTTAPTTATRPTTAPTTATRPTSTRPTTTRPTTTRPTTTRPTTTGPTTTGPTSSAPSSGGSCATGAGKADVGGPGVGTVTVNVKVCGGTISTVSSSLSQSNYGRNTQALPAMDKLALQYGKSNISMVTYSGATYTATAYRSALTSALSNAK